MTYILGINAFHGDASACLIRDGVILAAAEEERFRRIKHWAGFPSEAIRYCLSEAGIGLAFEPFRRLATGRPSRGTGLGLPLTKALAEANHASLTIKSKEHEGTLVEVVFPPACILAE